MTSLLLLVLVAVIAHTAFAKARRPLLRDGLFEGDEFTPVEEFTDEFRGSFNHDKWYNYNPRWRGRQPGLFAAKNVKQARGKLFLKGVYEEPGSSAFDDAPDGYETYTTSFVQSKKNVKFGYFEVKAKPGNSRLSSSFWGSLDTPKLWTEIDVFEIGGGTVYNGIDFRKRINMNLHVFRHTKKGIEPNKNVISKPTYYTHSSFLRSRFNTYGLDWSKKFITWTFNGRAIRRDRNKYWRQAFPVKFDVETMPNWFGLPSRKTLPATYKLKYVRAWSRKEISAPSAVRSVRSISLSSVSDQQVGNMFGLGVSGPPSSDEVLPEDNEDDDSADEVGDSAETEVVSPTEPETDAPQDGLQRAPIPGSNEVLYRPVIPAMGRTWSDLIVQQNVALDDLDGAQIATDEIINLADFDEELVLFPPARDNAMTGTPQENTESEPIAPLMPAAPPANSGTANENDRPKTLFGGFLPKMPWSTR